MKKADLLNILITFSVGLVAGAYLYLAGGFASVERELAVPDAESTTAFTITSDVYGGCRSACPSFQVQGNGEYRYISVPGFGEDPVVRQGTLPLPLQRRLRTVLDEDALEMQSQPRQAAMCNSYSDGIDVVYEIVISGEEYTLDSCNTTVQSESALWIALGELWTYYENLGSPGS